MSLGKSPQQILELWAASKILIDNSFEERSFFQEKHWAEPQEVGVLIATLLHMLSGTLEGKKDSLKIFFIKWR